MELTFIKAFEMEQGFSEVEEFKLCHIKTSATGAEVKYLCHYIWFVWKQILSQGHVRCAVWSYKDMGKLDPNTKEPLLMY